MGYEVFATTSMEEAEQLGRKHRKAAIIVSHEYTRIEAIPIEQIWPTIRFLEPETVDEVLHDHVNP